MIKDIASERINAKNSICLLTVMESAIINSCAFLHPKKLFLYNKKIYLVEKQLGIVNNQIIGMDKKLNLLEQQGEAGNQKSKVTKDLLNQVARLTTENKD